MLSRTRVALCSFQSLTFRIWLRLGVFHWHPQYEIIFISGGSGKRFIDGQVSQYENGDLIFLGPNITHVGFRECVLQGHYQIVVQFDDLFGDEFLNHIELTPLKRLIARAQGGIVFSENAKTKLSKSFQSLMSLLDISVKMCHSYRSKVCHSYRMNLCHLYRFKVCHFKG